VKTPPTPRPDAVTVELATGERLAAIEADWRALIACADTPNVFMNPLLVKLAAQAYPGRRFVTLLAWHSRGERRRLVGVWAFTVGRAPRSVLPVRALTMPAMAHTAMPVIDPDLIDATLQAMLTHITGDPSLPKLAALDGMAADGPTMQALARVLAGRGSTPSVLARSARPKLVSPLDGKQYLERALSSGSRKKLRQHRRRLAAKGALESTVVRDAEGVRAALERFLQLEAAGWKGRRNSALLNDAAEAAFTRAMVGELAERGDAAIHMLMLDGAPVSMQIVLRAGRAAFTWKTTYDENWRDASPGMLLLEDYTTAFLADRSIAYVDSCAHDETSFMAAWSERQETATLWIDCRPGGSLAFAALTRLQKTYLALRAAAKRLYLSARKRRS
jgi:CelD/BcsL family acetyltransferase involved in cellulose biosynthesis